MWARARVRRDGKPGQHFEDCRSDGQIDSKRFCAGLPW
jgi:hypothetical protein